MADIQDSHIQSLLGHFHKNTYRTRLPDKMKVEYEMTEICRNLLSADYTIIEINNDNGNLCAHYPVVILIPEHEKYTNGAKSFLPSSGITSAMSSQQDTIYESIHDSRTLREYFSEARFARCRTRFSLPTILYKGKYACRSATLSGGPEILGRKGFTYFFNNPDNQSTQQQSMSPADPVPEAMEAEESSMEPMSEELNMNSGDWHIFNMVRSADIKLLKYLNVGTIVDLMVEKKKVKFGVNVTSSEKVDKENRYSDFTIISLPYPGCEFFRDFRDNNYCGIDLLFDWSQSYVDATIGVPDNSIVSQLNISWDNYKEWDLVIMTQNYLKLLLKYFHENSSGILIHCISGWDRTPLFVSLLRLSLWADKVIHQSLTPRQILYYTLAYDWYLFGHNLPDRISKGEEILFFCFHFLKYITSDDYSVLPRYKSKHSSGSSSTGVGRSDSESAFDEQYDDELIGSNISLNSVCNFCGQKCLCEGGIHQDECINGNSAITQSYSEDSNSSIEVLSNDRSNLGNNRIMQRTSPVSVPTNGNLHRQRNESTSSTSSWQIVTGTGSYRSNDSSSLSAISINNHDNLSTDQSINVNMQDSTTSMQDSTTTLKDDELLLENPLKRRNRLERVRGIFISLYASTCGFKFKDGSDGSLGQMMGNIAEKVGFTQRSAF